MPTILTIAGFDPSSGAGITADLAVVASHHCFGISAITALTVQSTLGVKACYPTPAAVLTETLECLCTDIRPDGIKIGMLATSDNVQIVTQFLRRLRAEHPALIVVLDPVIRATSGAELLSAEGIQHLSTDLLPLADWVTPNLHELQSLTGLSSDTPDRVEVAAAAFQRTRPRLGIIVTGGHLSPPNDLVSPAGIPAQWLKGETIVSRSTHGTGCAFSTAFLCGLVHGLDPQKAARNAKDFVITAIRHAPSIGGGRGPMNLHR